MAAKSGSSSSCRVQLGEHVPERLRAQSRRLLLVRHAEIGGQISPPLHTAAGRPDRSCAPSRSARDTRASAAAANAGRSACDGKRLGDARGDLAAQLRRGGSCVCNDQKIIEVGGVCGVGQIAHQPVDQNLRLSRSLPPPQRAARRPDPPPQPAAAALRGSQPCSSLLSSACQNSSGVTEANRRAFTPQTSLWQADEKSQYLHSVNPTGRGRWGSARSRRRESRRSSPRPARFTKRSSSASCAGEARSPASPSGPGAKGRYCGFFSYASIACRTASSFRTSPLRRRSFRRSLHRPARGPHPGLSLTMSHRPGT